MKCDEKFVTVFSPKENLETEGDHGQKCDEQFRRVFSTKGNLETD